MRCTWNERKNQRNLRLHGISFEDVVQFDGPTLEQVGERFDYEEIRIYAIGLANGMEITLIHTESSEDERRITSAWDQNRTSGGPIGDA